MGKLLLFVIGTHLRSVAALALFASFSLAGNCSPTKTSPLTDTAQAASEFSFADLDFEPVSDAESLPSGVITALVQDRNGWMWIGTPAGLVRYDGYRFRRFAHDDTDPTSLAGDYVNVLWAGTDGKIWIGTNSDGLSIFDPSTERFNNIRNSGVGPDAVGDHFSLAPADVKIWALTGDRQGGVWVGSNEGLVYWPPGKSTPQRFRHDPAKPGSLADNRVRSLLVDRHGVLWVGSTVGLQRRALGGAGFEQVASNPADLNSLAGQDIRALFEAADGKLWIGTREQGAAWIGLDRAVLHRLALVPNRDETVPHRFIRSITQPLPGQIWFGTFDDHGIDVVDARDGRILQQARHDPSNAGSLSLDSIGALLVDRSGLMWVGTWGSGLQRHNPTNRAIRLLHHNPARPGGLSHADIRSVLEMADGRLLLGTGGNGIDILDRRRGLIGGYRPRPSRVGALGDGTISALVQTADGAIWAGTPQAGAFRLAPGASSWQGFATAQGLPHANIRKLLVSRDGNLWAGTDSGLARWLPQQQRFEAVSLNRGGKMRAVVYALSEDAEGRIWIGTNAGLWLKKQDGSAMEMVSCRPKSPDCLASDYINGLLIDGSDRLWIATAKGLDRFKGWEGNHATFEHISASAGKPGKYPGANLLQDRLGRIWTQWMVFDPISNHLVELSRADGMNVGTSWDRAYASTKDGLFLFGGTQGLAVVDPQQFKLWRFQPVVQASELMIDGHAEAWGRLFPRLTIGPDQRSFTIDLASLDYSAPLKNRYSYRLDGYDTDWIGERQLSWPVDDNYLGRFAT